MYIIKTLQDFDNIRFRGTHSAAVIDYVECYYRQLLDSIEADDDLAERYQMFVLEAEDRLPDSVYPKQQESVPIPSLHLEYAELHTLAPNCQMYKAAFMLDNESMVFVFAERSHLEPETEKWLRSRCRLDENELILQKLTETFERQSGSVTDPGTIDHVWVMAAAIRPFTADCAAAPFLPLALEQTNHWRSQSTLPTHFVRVILRTTSPQGMNPYVDGTDFCMIVDELRQNADFFMEDECFEYEPKYQGSELASALSWLGQIHKNPLIMQLNDPFLTEGQLQQLTHRAMSQ
ncbi:hypothetical protein [Paenibacillus whitsoniae]|uniref:Uncharacterized protein n=1 Tax=Paenibacillus whitsoniae TaxID=2496558 RepID=A0A430J5F6_9BACL|nr:hypothetical protein [Paenibacillus whitsoniae]RTE02760.1 hypothetical protein EJQ19_29030 [Paenibacillus whitsoniae]